MKFKPRFSAKISLIFIVVLFYGTVVFLGYLAVQSLFFEDFFILPVFISFVFFYILAFALWQTLILYALHKMELVIGPTALELRSIHGAGKFLPRFYRPFTIDYKSITKIKHEVLNGETWRIIDANGSSMWLAPFSFEKRDKEYILTELRARVPEQCFEEGFFAFELEWKKRTRVRMVAVLILYAIVFFFIITDSNLFFRSLIVNAWEVEEKVPAFENLRSSYSVPDGSLWLLSEKFPSDRYFVYYRGVDGLEREFELPESEITYFSVISADEAGNPIIWMEDRVMYHTNTWQIIPYTNNLQQFFHIRRNGH
ncbi:MAG: hypothetical protein IPL71_11005 [Anaerolineales bacterium]|uniref:hypothetical protein n=1 Tax=Candidatus Villigracilis proximus TaxID=3140683 RepID=UPI0031352E6C|nr:hypothetical protein [Anaerolineales bacterium]